jgi:hypothetical protein
MKNKRVVFLGEIGIPEQWYQDLTEKETITNRWDRYWGVCEVLSVPYCIQWQLYCNEPKLTNTETATTVRSREEMKGFWLVRPDGTKSFAAAYFTALLNKAGSSLKN